MKKRIKSKSITMYIDPKYSDKILYLKYTSSVTEFFEKALDKLKVDEDKLAAIKAVQALKK